MHGRAFAHILAGEQATIEIPIIVGVDFKRWQVLVQQAGEECVGGFSRFALPEWISRRFAALTGHSRNPSQGFCRCDVRGCQILEARVARLCVNRDERSKGRLKSIHERARAVPVFLPQPPDSGVLAFVFGMGAVRI